MSAFPSADKGQRNEVETAKPSQRADSSSVLRSGVRETATTAPAGDRADAVESNHLASGVHESFATGNGLAPDAAEPRPVAALPCHKSNNCTNRNNESTVESLSPYHRKARHRLIQVIEWMVREYGLNHVGLMTLTFGVPGSGRGSEATRELREQAKDLSFVQERWHSLNSHVIAKRYPIWVCVLETHKDGVWHFHVVVVTKADIRTGTNVEIITNYDLPFWMRRGKPLRNDALAKEWYTLRKTCCKYRFGRVELVPIRKTGEALARYIAGYLSKSLKGMKAGRRKRLVRMSRNVSKQFTMTFAVWNIANLIYRTRLKMAASMLHFAEYGDFADYFGPRWNYYLGDIIAGIPVPFEFRKDDFQRGFAAKILADYAENPFPYLDEEKKKQMAAVNSALLEKFSDLAFDEAADMRWRESRPVEADNIDVGRLTSEDLQDDLLENSENPF
jgi:hypothetical protein